MLTCENITCIRGHKTIFSQLGFCLTPGSLLLLKGANGAGKSSLLEILSGALQPATGQVSWDGAPISKNSDFIYNMLAIGHVGGVPPKLTVSNYLQKIAKKFDTEMLLPAALKFYDLEPYKDMRIGTLSTGWQRRMALAALIVAPCKLWLLDEPTDFLDEESVALTVSLIETRVQQGGIVIAASHSLKSGVEAHALDVGDFKTVSS